MGDVIIGMSFIMISWVLTLAIAFLIVEIKDFASEGKGEDNG